jgi:hypothetical protein
MLCTTYTNSWAIICPMEVRCLTPLSKIFQLLLLWRKLEYPEKSHRPVASHCFLGWRSSIVISCDFICHAVQRILFISSLFFSLGERREEFRMTTTIQFDIKLFYKILFIFLGKGLFSLPLHNPGRITSILTHINTFIFQWTPTKNILSANQLFSLIDMKRKFINSDNHKFHRYQ